MDRVKFIKTLGCAIIGAPLAMNLLQSCESIYYAQSQFKEDQIVLKKTEFLQKKSDKNSFRNFVLISESREGYPICVVRLSDEKYVASLLKCTHQGCELDVGGGIYSCPCHGSEFSTQGTLLQGPAEKDLKTFPIITDNENIYINLI